MVNLICRSSVEDTSGKVTAFMFINEYELIIVHYNKWPRLINFTVISIWFLLLATKWSSHCHLVLWLDRNRTSHWALSSSIQFHALGGLVLFPTRPPLQIQSPFTEQQSYRTYWVDCLLRCIQVSCNNSNLFTSKELPDERPTSTGWIHIEWWTILSLL